MTDQVSAFLDSNVLVSALIVTPESAPVVLVDWLAGGQLGLLLTSRLNVAEVERNLQSRLVEALPLWREFLLRSGVEIVAGSTGRARGINSKDSAIVASAARSGATHFVTGDKRLLAEMKKAKFKQPFPVTPREMLDVLLLASR